MIVLTYGTFDLYHYGHKRLLERAAGLGTKLIVGLSVDRFNAEKGKESILNYEHRKEIIGSVRYVDKIIPEESWGQKPKDIKREKADLLVMGSDWSGAFDYLSDIVEVIYLPRTEGVSTTDIKNALLTHALQHKERQG